jgi:hypothetical protein
MANTTNPFPPMPPPQPADVGVQFDSTEQPIHGFQYQVSPNVGPPSTLVTLAATRYYEYAITKTVYDWSGLKVTPLQGPIGTPASVTRECAPWGEMALHWLSTRHGSNPLIPSRDLGDPNVIYKNGWVSFPTPGFLADGTPAITIEGCYFYWLRLPYAETDTLVAATNPYLSGEAAATLSAGDYSTLIAGPNVPPAGAPTNKITF